MGNRKASRDTICDGWGEDRGHATERSREYRLDIGQGEPYEDVWLCDGHATQMCAEWWLVGQFTSPVQVYRDQRFVRTEQRKYGVWVNPHIKDSTSHA